MPIDYLHRHPNFPDLLAILEQETGILAGLIEKDYWIMHVLYGLQQQGFTFFLKGGTSLSKGYGIIDRFSEDIDILIEPKEDLGIITNPKKTDKKARESRRSYYDSLAQTIRVDGIIAVERDHAFDDTAAYRSGGIRLQYPSTTSQIEGVKEGILLEAGFDTVTPNRLLTISSWAYERAKTTPGLSIRDNRAVDVACYHPGYTFVEKLQTVVTKFRKAQEQGEIGANLMRQYYDLYCLLDLQEVQDFIATEPYQMHKQARFPKADLELPICENPAFLLQNAGLKAALIKRYQETAPLYYKGQPPFEDLLARIQAHLDRL